MNTRLGRKDSNPRSRDQNLPRLLLQRHEPCRRAAPGFAQSCSCTADRAHKRALGTRCFIASAGGPEQRRRARGARRQPSGSDERRSVARQPEPVGVSLGDRARVEVPSMCRVAGSAASLAGPERAPGHDQCGSRGQREADLEGLEDADGDRHLARFSRSRCARPENDRVIGRDKHRPQELEQYPVHRPAQTQSRSATGGPRVGDSKGDTLSCRSLARGVSSLSVVGTLARDVSKPR
jgi:hypothetical protein